MTKQCRKCKAARPIDSFFRDKSLLDGRANICKTCKTISTQEWRVKNRDKYNSDMKKYRTIHYQRLRMQRYKITPEIHAAFLLEQKGVCAICGKLPQGKRPLVIDHCHNTKVVRGLLCYGCNRALVTLETPGLLQKAMNYLNK